MSHTSSHSIGHKLRSFMPMFMRKKNDSFTRRHARHECVVLATMTLSEIGGSIEGVLVELSAGGCAFRPASVFMLDRTDELISIQTEYFETSGRIRAVRPASYGIQFFEDLDETLVEQVVGLHAGKLSESFLARRV